MVEKVKDNIKNWFHKGNSDAYYTMYHCIIVHTYALEHGVWYWPAIYHIHVKGVASGLSANWNCKTIAKLELQNYSKGTVRSERSSIIGNWEVVRSSEAHNAMTVPQSLPVYRGCPLLGGFVMGSSTACITIPIGGGRHQSPLSAILPPLKDF